MCAKSMRIETESFVGRQRELQLLRSCTESLQTGSGRIVTVKGPGGIGKTRILREFADAVSGTEIHVGIGRSYESEESAPLAVWDQIAHSLKSAAAKQNVKQGSTREAGGRAGISVPRRWAPHGARPPGRSRRARGRSGPGPTRSRPAAAAPGSGAGRGG